MATQAPAINLSKYIEIKVFGERPHIRGRRVPVASVAYNARTNGWDVAELCDAFGLSQAEVLAALLYYEEHQLDIDRLENEELAEMEKMYQKHSKP